MVLSVTPCPSTVLRNRGLSWRRKHVDQPFNRTDKRSNLMRPGLRRSRVLILPTDPFMEVDGPLVFSSPKTP